jgi:hypothetical protein
MATAFRRLVIALCLLVSVLSPLAIVRLGYAYGYDRLPSDDDFREWPLYAIDSLFWADACSTVALFWLMQRWRWLAALVAVPLLCVTAVLAIFNGMWVAGTYF